jgi:predicted nucleotidyltransferase
MKPKATEFDTVTISRIKKICTTAKWPYIMMFGSAVKNPELARDIDLAVPYKLQSLLLFSNITTQLEKVFKKKVDLIYLDSVKSPRLILEILANSKMLYASATGLEQFAVTADRIHALATEEVLRYPQKEQLKNMKNISRRLHA